MSVNLVKPIRHNEWTTEFFDCCEEPTSCCEALWCPWCQLAAQHNRLTRNAVGVDSLCCCMLCMLDSCCMCGLASVCTALKHRGIIQRRFGIPINDFINCGLSCCCLPCVISQNYREMCYRGAYPGGLCVNPPVGLPMGAQQTMQIMTTTNVQNTIALQQLQQQQQYPQQQQQQQFYVPQQQPAQMMYPAGAVVLPPPPQQQQFNNNGYGYNNNDGGYPPQPMYPPPAFSPRNVQVAEEEPPFVQNHQQQGYS